MEESDEPAFNSTSDSNQNGSTSLMIEKTVNSEVEKNQNDTYGLWVGSHAEDVLFGLGYIPQLLYALFVKRLIHTLRNKTLVISQICIPLGVLLIDLFYIKYGPVKNEDSPMLVMGLNSYRENYAAYQMRFSNGSDPVRIGQVEQWAKMFAQSVNVFANAKAFRLDTNDTVNVCQNARG